MGNGSLRRVLQLFSFAFTLRSVHLDQLRDSGKRGLIAVFFYKKCADE